MLLIEAALRAGRVRRLRATDSETGEVLERGLLLDLTYRCRQNLDPEVTLTLRGPRFHPGAAFSLTITQEGPCAEGDTS